MKITSLLKPEFVVEDLKSRTKEEVLAELAAVAADGLAGFDSLSLVKVLMARESLGSTGIGDGIAMPHGTVRGLDELLVVFGRSKGGVDFSAADGKPVHLFFLLLAPERSSSAHLRLLARIARMLKDAAFRKRLMESGGRKDLYEVIAEKDDEM